MINNAEDKVIIYNKNLKEICLKIIGSFDGPVERLKFIERNLKPINEYKHRSGTLLGDYSAETAMNSPVFQASYTGNSSSGLNETAGAQATPIKNEPASDKDCN